MEVQTCIQKSASGNHNKNTKQMIIYLLVVMVMLHFVAGHSLSDVKRLKKELLDYKLYDRKLRPSLNQTEPIEVEIYLAITNIHSLNIVSGKLLSPGYLFASWTDEQLIWNSSNFDGLDQLSLTANDIWLPSLVQFGATDAEFILGPLWVYNNGTVNSISAGMFEANCKLDVLHFPYDTHLCMFEILSASADASEIRLNILATDDVSETLLEHGEWEVEDSNLTVQEFTEPISGKTFVSVLKTVTVSRRYQFTLIHTCLPLLLLTSLNIFIYIVPLRSGERISFSTSILLNIVLLTSSVSDNLPHNSLRLPYLSILMTITTITTTLGVIFSVILCRIDQETIVPMPEFLRNIASKYVSCKAHKSSPISESKDPDEISNAEQKLSERNNTTEIANDDITWSVVAELIDKLLFFLNLIIVVTAIAVFISLIRRV